MGDLESQEEDVPNRVSWYKPMTCLGVSRPHHRVYYRWWDWVSITIDKFRVFINKTVINWESYHSTIDKRVDSSIIDWFSVNLDNLWGHYTVSVQNTIYMFVGVSDNDKCVSMTPWQVIGRYQNSLPVSLPAFPVFTEKWQVFPFFSQVFLIFLRIVFP